MSLVETNSRFQSECQVLGTDCDLAQAVFVVSLADWRVKHRWRPLEPGALPAVPNSDAGATP